jgi:hypothetical protein
MNDAKQTDYAAEFLWPSEEYKKESFIQAREQYDRMYKNQLQILLPFGLPSLQNFTGRRSGILQI